MSKSWLYPVAILAGLVALSLAVFFGLQKSALKVGAVNLEEVKNRSKKGQEIVREIEEKQREIQDRILQAREKGDEETELQLRREFENYVQARSNEFETLVEKKIAEVARNKNIQIVFPEPVISYARDIVDLTDDLLKEL